MYRFFIALRYLRARWIMSTAAVVAVSLAVFSLVVVRSVFQGFGDQMRAMVRGTTSDLVLTTIRPMNLPYYQEISEDIDSLSHVTGASPYVRTMTMFQAQTIAGPYTDYLEVKGVEPVQEAKVSDLEYSLLRDEKLKEILSHPRRPIPRPERRKPLSPEEIASLFSAEHRDKLWQNYKARFKLRSAGDTPSLENKLPPPAVVGIQTLVGGNHLIDFDPRYGSLIRLTTYSPRKRELKTGEFLVVGAFHTGRFEADRRMIYVPLRAACEFADLFDPALPDSDNFPAGGWRVSGVGIALDDYEKHKEEVAKNINDSVLPNYVNRVLRADSSVDLFHPSITTWEEQKRNLLRAVDIERGIVTLIVGILIVFIGAIIFLILTLNITEKRRDIGILKAVGSTEESISSIFLLHGGAICLIGLLLGFFLGLLFCGNINTIHDFIYAQTGWQLFPPDIYYMDRIPVSIKPLDLVKITAFTVLFGFLGSLLPAIWAARQDPIKAIHTE